MPKPDTGNAGKQLTPKEEKSTPVSDEKLAEQSWSVDDSNEHYARVEIRKPLHGNFCYIRESLLKQAIKDGKWLEVKVPNGVGHISPQLWMGTGKRMTKVFKYENNPMVLYGNEVPINY